MPFTHHYIGSDKWGSKVILPVPGTTRKLQRLAFDDTNRNNKIKVHV